MIKGTRVVNLSAEEIFKRLSSYDIYRKYIGSFRINDSMCNPFRKDNHPSFMVTNKTGELLHQDFAVEEFRGNCIQLVEQINNCNFNEALRIIDKDFNLGICAGKPNDDYKKEISQYKQPEEAGKRYCLIQVVTRKFTSLDLEYWNSYFQSEDDLRANHIYSIKEVYLNKKKYLLDKNYHILIRQSMINLM